MIEAEVKARADHKHVLDLLGKNMAKYIGSSSMVDTYYSIGPGEALRLRQSDRGTFITYKGPKITGKSRKEIQLHVLSGGDAEDLLTVLGYHKKSVIKKKRTEYKIDCATVSLDTVEGLGDFVEIEIMTHEDLLPSTLEKIRWIAKKLDVGPFINESYPELINA